MNQNTIKIMVFVIFLIPSHSCQTSKDPNSEFKPDKLQKLNYTDSIKLPNESQNIDLEVDLLPNIYFLEHVYSWKRQASSDTVIFFNGDGDILVSDDLGQNLITIVKGEKHWWTGCLTTRTGKHLLWDYESKSIWSYSKDWKFIRKIKTGDYCWHGNWSIAEMNGTIIYAEYTDQVEKVNVWRSVDDGENWSIVFSQNGRSSKNPEIRHFHTVQPDPYNKNNWYLSSGDWITENKIWLSTDDGITWKEITDPTRKGSRNQQINRYTAIIFKKDYIYWGTDDVMDGQAKFVRVKRTIPLNIEVLSNMGNAVRSSITVGDGALFLTESKTLKNAFYTDATIHYSPEMKEAYLYQSLKNLDNTETGFSYSRSSISSKDDVFFTYFGGHLIFPNQTGSLRWKVLKKS